jgi:hypothetical protein
MFSSIFNETENWIAEQSVINFGRLLRLDSTPMKSA